MNEINWITIIVSVISGGAMGAFIKQIFDNKKNKIQPIGRSIEIKSFYDSESNKFINSRITLTEGDKEHKFSMLYTGTISIINTGVNDYNEFNFGITCPENIKFIQIKSNSSDRHHKAELTSSPSLENRLNILDIKLQPFNRKDNYSFDILITADRKIHNMDDIVISSSHSIKWIEIDLNRNIVISKSDMLLLEGITNVFPLNILKPIFIFIARSQSKLPPLL